MARSVRRLEVSAMSDRALWNFVLGNLADITPWSLLPYQYQKLLFENVNKALLELHQRGQQLQLPTYPHAS